jgi:uncharacterized protein (TIGR02246 family)
VHAAAFFVALTAAAGGAVPADPAAERAAIQVLLDAHGAAWTRGDAAAAAAVMTEDAEWITSTGKVVRGRAAIEALHREWFAGRLKGSRHSHPGTPDIRFVRPDVALVDGDSYVGGLLDEQGRERPASISTYTAVFTKENGRWLVTAFRSLGPKPAPAAGPAPK